MTDHPITPPPELVQQWMSEFYGSPAAPGELALLIAARAAQWGADQELDACCDWMSECTVGCPNELRAVRRPKHKTRAEIALEQYDRCVSILKEKGYSPAGYIRDALVRLTQLEDSND